MRSIRLPRTKLAPPRIWQASRAQNSMVCVAWTLSSAKSPGKALPFITLHAAWSIQAWVAVIRRSMSASLWRIAWLVISGLPKVSRCRAQSSASSKQMRAKAAACWLMPSRSPLKLRMIPAKPPFSGPIRFSAGTSTSSKWIVAVSLACQPIFCSAVRDTPGRSVSTSSREMPPKPGPPVRTASVM